MLRDAPVEEARLLPPRVEERGARIPPQHAEKTVEAGPPGTARLPRPRSPTRRRAASINQKMPAKAPTSARPMTSAHATVPATCARKLEAGAAAQSRKRKIGDDVRTTSARTRPSLDAVARHLHDHRRSSCLAAATRTGRGGRRRRALWQVAATATGPSVAWGQAACCSSVGGLPIAVTAGSPPRLVSVIVIQQARTKGSARNLRALAAILRPEPTI